MEKWCAVGGFDVESGFDGSLWGDVDVGVKEVDISGRV